MLGVGEGRVMVCWTLGALLAQPLLLKMKPTQICAQWIWGIFDRTCGVEVPGPGIEPTPQQCQILNTLCHKGTSWVVFLVVEQSS